MYFMKWTLIWPKNFHVHFWNTQYILHTYVHTHQNIKSLKFLKNSFEAITYIGINKKYLEVLFWHIQSSGTILHSLYFHFMNECIYIGLSRHLKRPKTNKVLSILCLALQSLFTCIMVYLKPYVSMGIVIGVVNRHHCALISPI